MYTVYDLAAITTKLKINRLQLWCPNKLHFKTLLHVTIRVEFHEMNKMSKKCNPLATNKRLFLRI